MRADRPNQIGLNELIEKLPLETRMVEVGSYVGESAEIFLASNKIRKITCVDNWPDPANDAEFLFDLMLPMNPIRLGKIKGESIKVACQFKDGVFDFVYLDADHEYDSVKADIAAWLPKIKVDGFIGGHDYVWRHPGVLRAVWEAFGKPTYVFRDSSWLVDLRFFHENRNLSIMDVDHVKQYFLPDGYKTNKKPVTWKRVDRVKFPQWYVYLKAQSLLKAGRVFDLGCGDGLMLPLFFCEEKGNYENFGFDLPEQIALCQGRPGTWIAKNLDNDVSLPDDADLIICADVLEHLKSPGYLLLELARLHKLRRSTIVLSTPERSLKHGLSDMGPPTNKCHVREWALGEFNALLKYFGMNADFEIVPNSMESIHRETILAVIHQK